MTALLFFWRLPGLGQAPSAPEQTVLSQLSAPLVFRTLWPPTLAALLLGVATGALFARTTRLRLGFLYAAALGFLIALFLRFFFVGVLNEIAFALTFTTFDEFAATVPVAVAQLSGRVGRPLSSYLLELLGPLTGVLVWALLKRSRNAETTPA